MEEGAGSSGSVPHRGADGSRSLDGGFGDQLLSNVIGSGPPGSTHGEHVSWSRCPGLSFHWH